MAVDWTPELVSELTLLHGTGESMSAIARQLRQWDPSITKNGVVAKCHRLKLPGRPSPIRANPTFYRAAAKATRAVNHPPQPRPERQVRAAPSRIRVKLSAVPESRHRCKWPIGDPGHSDFHFCEGRALEGKPYCLPHCEQAFTGATAASVAKR